MQREERRRAREAVENAGLDASQVPFVCIMESATGRILMGAEAPAPHLLDQFLQENQGWEVLPEDDEDMSDTEKEGERDGGKEQAEGDKKEKSEKKHKPKVEDDEYRNAGGEANYYSIAHTIKEEVKCQPSILVNGQLKEYQIKVTNFITIFNNNNNNNF